MIQVKLNYSNENPFYGLKNCLTLFQNTNKAVTDSLLDACYNEVKNDKVKREMFFSLLFSIGDITARQHNIFKGKKRDNGGNANREGFYTAFMWLKTKHFNQFEKFLYGGLFNEYTCFDLLFKSRVKTDRKGKVLRVFDMFAVAKYRETLANYIYSIVKGNNNFNKFLVAKFLTLPRLSKRSNHKRMLSETRVVMENKTKFLMYLSEVCGWEYDSNTNYCNFVGYRKWRQQYNKDLESVLFSSGKINEYTKDQFIEWFDKLPAQARFRVKNRILYSTVSVQVNTTTLKKEPKYPKLQEWYKEWECYKAAMQSQQRILEEKIRQGEADDTDIAKLKEVKKHAKVTTGAVNFTELYNNIRFGKVDKLALESFSNKISLPYNSLVFIDDSGSMRGEPFNFAAFIAACCLIKNPDDDGRNLLGFFNNSCHMHSYIDKTSKSRNSILRVEVAKQKAVPLVDPKLSFYDNYVNISNFCKSVFHGGGTNISGIPEGLNLICKAYPEVYEALKNYPVWTIISDSEWNNLYSPEASMNDFMRKCENYFGYKPFIVAIDADLNPRYARNPITRFSGIDNMIYIPANVGQIEQFLTNFKDMDTFDVYMPLLSLYRSNRYNEVRLLVI